MRFVKKTMEKEPDSMATVQMKADYAASEVYSTASEAPPVSVFYLSNWHNPIGLNGFKVDSQQDIRRWIELVSFVFPTL